MSLSEAKLREAASIAPSPRQLAWQELEFYGFVHFGMNTFTGREWGDGRASPALFDPARLDPDQWAAAFKSAGMQGLILTCKHHDGFCLWPSAHTDYSVKHAPWKGGRGDVVAETAAACRRAGLKFGVYLSPWDRHDPRYGAGKPYDDYYVAQLTELLTGYGELFCVWLDGACGEGPNGRRQVYDWPRYYRTIRALQPGAVISVCGPDVRWCGNEAGAARESEWAVVPMELCKYSRVQTGPAPMADKGDLSFLYNSARDIGTLDIAMFSKGLTFTPAEIDTSIRKGWFWHKEEEPKSLEALFHIYINAVGGNCCLNLNIPPTTEGLLDERDVRRLKELGELLRERFGTEIQAELVKREKGDVFQQEYEIRFREPCNDVRYVVIEEDLKHGQRIESFQLVKEKNGYEQYPVYQGRTVGNRKICELWDSSKEQNPLLFGNEDTPLDHLVLRITSARGEPFLRSVKVY